MPGRLLSTPDLTSCQHNVNTRTWIEDQGNPISIISTEATYRKKELMEVIKLFCPNGDVILFHIQNLNYNIDCLPVFPMSSGW